MPTKTGLKNRRCPSLDGRLLWASARLLDKEEVDARREARLEEDEQEKGDPVLSSRPSAGTGGGVVPSLLSEDKVVRRYVD
jgi:hypothetical protein